MRTRDEVPLSIAAQRLGLSWERAWRLVLQGRIRGRKVSGRWMVSWPDTERLADELDGGVSGSLPTGPETGGRADE
ncbi:MAG: hypothetical protein ACYSVY_05910 [Planctomycetota bacterium]|jgi:hypothetical protein